MRNFCEVDLWAHEIPPSRGVILKRIEGMEGIFSLLTDQIDGEVMDAAGSELKVISNCAVGFDNIDVHKATQRGIPVGHTPGVLTDTTADFAFSLLMAAGRRVVEGNNFTRAGKWKTWGLTLLLGRDITGSTLGIIGFGRIGKGMAKRAQGFDMQVLYFDPLCKDDPFAAQIGARYVDLDTLLGESDFVSVHTPLNEDTYHLIDSKALSKMKPTAILINTARGPIVDADALFAALEAGIISYAALDVTEPEPIPRDHPLLTLDNVIITPHVASASVATRGKMIQMAVENLISGLEGERLPFCANPEVYEG